MIKQSDKALSCRQIAVCKQPSAVQRFFPENVTLKENGTDET